MPFSGPECFYTIVKNTSGQRRFFSFLPPHGKWLNANETYMFYGYPWETRRYSHGSSQRYIDAFHNALMNGELKLISTPAPIVANATSSRAIGINLAGNVVAVAGKCYT